MSDFPCCDPTPCPSRWHDVRCVRTGPHTEHTDGYAVRWEYATEEGK